MGVYSGVGDNTITEYIQSVNPLKIATTYDSLPRVINTIKEYGMNPYKDTFLLVDEWHTLFNSYEFRYDAITNLLNTAKQFERATYLSATTIEREYMLTQLRHLPMCEVI